MIEEKEKIWKKHCEDFPKIKTWSNEKQETAKKAYLAGYEQSREDCKSKWHDLRKDPNDLPRRSKKRIDLSIPVLLSNKTISYYSYEEKEWRCVENGRKQSLIIAWCELPKFEG